jgi:cytochrome c biogenesis protein CcmG, thiol:disulfide interchange protein DsbE
LPSTRSSGPTEPPGRRHGWLLILAGVIVVGLVAGLLLAVLGRDSKSDGSKRRGAVTAAGVAEVGSPAPDFVLPALDGSSDLRLADFRGRPVIVNFWASWCNPCRDEFPLLKKALREHEADRLAMIGVTYQDIPDDSRAFVKRMTASWPQGTDESGSVAKAYGVRGIPQTFFVRSDGTIAARVFGITTQEKLDEPLGRLLAR